MLQRQYGVSRVQHSSVVRSTPCTSLARRRLCYPRQQEPTWLLQPLQLSAVRRHLLRHDYSTVRAASSVGEPSAEGSEAELENDFDLLSTKISELVAEVDTELKGCSLYLVGMMGSGKSTVAKMIANTLKYKCFDVDTMVELAHENKKVSEIFKEYGQEYFRDCEAQVLKQLSPYKSCIIATGGGAVLRPMNWSYMQQGIVVWLQGSPELLARRVAMDGLEKRPLLAEGAEGTDFYSIAHKKVTNLLSERTKFYENADIHVSLEGNGVDAETGAPTAVVMYRILKKVKAKIEATKEEREAKKNFKIENADSMKTMRTVPSPNQQDPQ